MYGAHSRAWVAGLAAGLFVLACGCDGTAVAYLFEERQGNVRVQIINNTGFRALITFGAWDALDRNPPSAPVVQQQRIEAHTSTTALTIQCRRNLAINTPSLIERIRDTNVDRSQNLDEDLLNDSVFFSSAPSGSPGGTLPTAGTAEGIEVRLGVNYTCEDLLIFTLVEDAAAPGGFRIEFRRVQDEEDDA